MKTKKMILAGALILAFSTVIAQPADKPAKERIEAMKIGFITQRLDLTPEEAKSFWPVYNKFSDELEAVRKTHRKNVEQVKKEFEDLSDKDVEKVVDGEIAFRQSELDIMKKYHPQFKQILPIKKVARLYRSEEDFKLKLLNMLKERKQHREERDN